MIVVSDTSPVSGLFRIERLELLRQLCSHIVIPNAVRAELLELEKREIDLVQIKNVPWIEVRSITSHVELEKFLRVVDRGEAEAIVLAKELKSTVLLIDETIGRSVAQDEGLNVVGLLGVLLLAKRKRLIKAVKPVLDELIDIASFRMTPELYNRILTMADEIT